MQRWATEHRVGDSLMRSSFTTKHDVQFNNNTYLAHGQACQSAFRTYVQRLMAVNAACAESPSTSVTCSSSHEKSSVAMLVAYSAEGARCAAVQEATHDPVSNKSNTGDSSAAMRRPRLVWRQSVRRLRRNPMLIRALPGKCP